MKNLIFYARINVEANINIEVNINVDGKFAFVHVQTTDFSTKNFYAEIFPLLI